MKPAIFPGVKRGNAYAALLGGTYNAAPKAVLAAIAVSFATTGGDNPDVAEQAILDEWATLHQAGIVAQAPPKAKVPA